MNNAIKFSSAKRAGDAFLGMEVSWDIGDSARSVAIDRVAFENLFIAAGADPNLFKPRPTPANSLPRACRIGWSHMLGIDSRLISVKELSRPNKDTPLAYAVLYRCSAEGEKDRWEVGARIRIENDVAVVRHPVDVDSYPNQAAERWAQACADYANERTHTAFNQDVSEALVAFGSSLGWVSRRQSGGVYFLPGTLGERFMQVMDGLEALTTDSQASFQGNATPQYADPRTLQTWQRRTESTFLVEIEQLTNKLKDMASRENVRDSSFDLRAAECSMLMARAEAYAEVLQSKLGPLKADLADLKAKFGDAQQALREAKAKGDKAFKGITDMAAKAAKKTAPKAPPAEPEKPAQPKRRLSDKASLDRLFDIN